MKCSICHHGETAPGQTTVTLTRGEAVVVLKGVPAEICGNCGEYYLEAKVAKQVAQHAETALQNGAEVSVQRYAA